MARSLADQPSRARAYRRRYQRWAGSIAGKASRQSPGAGRVNNDYQEFFKLTDTAVILDRALAYVADEEGHLAVGPGNEAYSTTPNIGLSGKAKGDTDTVFVSTAGASAPELLQVSLDAHHFYRFDTWNALTQLKPGKQEAGAVSLDR